MLQFSLPLQKNFTAHCCVFFRNTCIFFTAIRKNIPIKMALKIHQSICSSFFMPMLAVRASYYWNKIGFYKRRLETEDEKFVEDAQMSKARLLYYALMLWIYRESICLIPSHAQFLFHALLK